MDTEYASVGNPKDASVPDMTNNADSEDQTQTFCRCKLMFENRAALSDFVPALRLLHLLPLADIPEEGIEKGKLLSESFSLIVKLAVAQAVPVKDDTRTIVFTADVIAGYLVFD